MTKYKQIKEGNAIRIAFLGCGDITRRHSKYAKKASKQIELSYASRNIDKSEEYRKMYGGKSAFGAYEDAINATDIDVVMINTPPHLHFELTEKALKAGKHVIVEKPPFFKSSDFDILGELAESKGLHLMVAENYFYKPLRRVIRELLERKIIGDPLFIHINATKKQNSKNDWREDKSLTGYGSLYEGGIHWINFINNLGYNLSNFRGIIPQPSEELERSIQVTASAEQGPVVNLLYSWEASTIFGGLRWSKIHGREGSITFETNGVVVIVRGKKKSIRMPDLKNISGYVLMFEDFFRALRTGDRPQFDWKMAQQDLESIEEVYSSSKHQ